MGKYLGRSIHTSAWENGSVRSNAAEAVLVNRISQIDTEAEARLSTSCKALQVGRGIVSGCEAEFCTASSFSLINSHKV